MMTDRHQENLALFIELDCRRGAILFLPLFGDLGAHATCRAPVERLGDRLGNCPSLGVVPYHLRPGNRLKHRPMSA